MTKTIKLTAMFAVAMVLAGAVAAFTVYSHYRMVETAELVAHTYAVEARLAGLLSRLQDVEIGARSFALTGEAAFRGPFDNAVDVAASQGRALCTFVRDARQAANCNALVPLIDERIALARFLVQLRVTRGFEAAQAEVASGRDKAKMDEIRVAVARMNALAETLLRERQEAADRVTDLTTQATVGGTGLAFVLLAGSFALVLRESRLHVRSAADLDRFFTLSLDLLCIAGVDGYFKRLSPAFTETLGYTTEELLTTPFLDLVHPDDRAATGAELAKLRDGTPTLEFQNRYRRRDGSWCWLSWRAHPIAHLGVVYCTARDVTGQRALQAELQTRVKLAEFQAAIGTALTKEGRLPVQLQQCMEEIVRLLDAACARVWLLNRHDQVLEFSAGAGTYARPDDAYARVPVGTFEIGQIAQDAKPYLTNQVVGDPRVSGQDWARREGMVAFAGYPLIADGIVVGVVAAFAQHPFSDAADAALQSVATTIALAIHRSQAEQEVILLNATLSQRAEQLRAMNTELEAFSYSVSHDLRAPLRAIDGFSQVLLEDQGDRLDEDGKDSLQRVRVAAGRMGELIDALIQLSRLGRVDLRAVPVNMSEVAADVVNGLRRSQPDRQVEVSIAPGLVADGDPTLLRVLIENLIGNAWKYSQPRASACIRFGAENTDGETVYFVRDNGVGFDMAYVGKLFGAFQRLHAPRDFSGTGIGLATVSRIIRRHGGRVWAEGAVDQGATFYFTLHDVPRSVSWMGQA